MTYTIWSSNWKGNIVSIFLYHINPINVSKKLFIYIMYFCFLFIIFACYYEIILITIYIFWITKKLLSILVDGGDTRYPKKGMKLNRNNWAIIAFIKSNAKQHKANKN